MQRYRALAYGYTPQSQLMSRRGYLLAPTKSEHFRKMVVSQVGFGVPRRAVLFLKRAWLGLWHYIESGDGNQCQKRCVGIERVTSRSGARGT
jgi:hypothetical protein